MDPRQLPTLQEMAREELARPFDATDARQLTWRGPARCAAHLLMANAEQAAAQRDRYLACWAELLSTRERFRAFFSPWLEAQRQVASEGEEVLWAGPPFAAAFGERELLEGFERAWIAGIYEEPGALWLGPTPLSLAGEAVVKVALCQEATWRASYAADWDALFIDGDLADTPLTRGLRAFAEGNSGAARAAAEACLDANELHLRALAGERHVSLIVAFGAITFCDAAQLIRAARARGLAWERECLARLPAWAAQFWALVGPQDPGPETLFSISL